MILIGRTLRRAKRLTRSAQFIPMALFCLSTPASSEGNNIGNVGVDSSNCTVIVGEAQNVQIYCPQISETTKPSTPIPITSLELFCGIDGDNNVDDLNEDEARQLDDFATFLEANSNSVVYVRVRIEKYCAACTCARELVGLEDNSDRKDSPRFGSVYFEDWPVEERSRRMGLDAPQIWGEGFQVLAFYPEKWPYAYSFYLPRQRHLAFRQYQVGEYGTLISYDGLFVARSYFATGGAAFHLDPIEASAELQSQLDCIRQTLSDDKNDGEANDC